jgi:hypothetical protein
LEHRASNPVSVKNLTSIETSTIVKLRPYVPVGTKRTNDDDNDDDDDDNNNNNIVPVALCESVICSNTLREEHRLRIFENKLLREIMKLIKCSKR